MTPDELERVAAAGYAVRPGWKPASLRTFLRKNFAHSAYGDVLIALVYVATRTDTRTPRLMLESGPWWDAAMVGTGQKAQRPCQKHPGQLEGLKCSKCAAEQRVLNRQRRRDSEQARSEVIRATSIHAPRVREALRAARAGSHRPDDRNEPDRHDARSDQGEQACDLDDPD